jgi:hypothetical protein
MEKEKITDIGQATAEASADAVLTLSKAYAFEGQTISEIDLSGLANLTAEDMIAADKYLTRNGTVATMPEMTLEYACFIASRAAALPVEFFRRLSPRDAIKLKNRVTSFFYGAD